MPAADAGMPVPAPWALMATGSACGEQSRPLRAGVCCVGPCRGSWLAGLRRKVKMNPAAVKQGGELQRHLCSVRSTRQGDLAAPLPALRQIRALTSECESLLTRGTRWHAVPTSVRSRPATAARGQGSQPIPDRPWFEEAGLCPWFIVRGPPDRRYLPLAPSIDGVVILGCVAANTGPRLPYRGPAPPGAGCRQRSPGGRCPRRYPRC